MPGLTLNSEPFSAFSSPAGQEPTPSAGSHFTPEPMPLFSNNISWSLQIFFHFITPCLPVGRLYLVIVRMVFNYNTKEYSVNR